MVTKRCWMLGSPVTSHEVEAEEEDVLADNYVAAHGRCTPGDVYFIEVETGDLWTVECISGRPLIVLLTERVDRVDAEEQLRQARAEGRAGPMLGDSVN